MWSSKKVSLPAILYIVAAVFDTSLDIGLVKSLNLNVNTLHSRKAILTDVLPPK